jgi:ATP-dependent RNA helicase DeaD
MGFRDELEGILEQLPEQRRTHLLSATFSGEVRRIAERFQKDPVFLEGSPLGAANEDIEHVAHVVGFRHRYDALINILLTVAARRTDDDPGRTLVFTRTRADTLEVAERLQKDGLRAEPLSGDLAQAQRTRTLSAFRSGRITTLIATDVAARGLDVQGVDLVVHLDPPGDPDAYTHRSGRTGRAGRKGTSILLLPPQARSRVERLLHAARIKPNWAPVPSADKVRKLYSKLGKRKLYSALEIETSEAQLEYARKVLAEHPADQVVARLLAMIDERPPCLPREISEHISSEHRGHKRSEARGPRRHGPGDGRREFRGDGRRDFRGEAGRVEARPEGKRPEGKRPEGKRGGPKHRLGGPKRRFR